jgi:hypothetical protein
MIGLRNTRFVAILSRGVEGVGPFVALDTFESYSIGALVDGSTLTGGTGWSGAAVLEFPYMALDDFESYALGSAGNGSGLTGGINWSGAPVLTG